jgi:5-histidylcysteine sulfoxide synthase
LDGEDIDKKRHEIREYFLNTCEIFESVFEVLKCDDVFYRQSEPTRHPMIFYYGHTATFFINKLINMKIIKNRIDPNFESIFAIGVDEMAWDDIDNAHYKWPKVEDVREYRKEVKELVEGLIMSMPLTLPITQDSDMWVILMGIEHERIHTETSLVLHRQMPIEFIKEVNSFACCKEVGDAPKNEMVTIPACKVNLGKKESHNLYGWDNEYGKYLQDVNEFKTSKYLVSNAEFMEFVKDGGYESREYWDEEGLKFLYSTVLNTLHFGF